MPQLCPCHSQKPYSACCQPYHAGRLPENALALMRSRYSAFVLELADYIIQTTHPTNPAYQKDAKAWKEEILAFCRDMRFVGLEIKEFIDGPNVAFVTFTAQLKQGEADASFTERSRFIKENGRWLYQSGSFSESP